MRSSGDEPVMMEGLQPRHVCMAAERTRRPSRSRGDTVLVFFSLTNQVVRRRWNLILAIRLSLCVGRSTCYFFWTTRRNLSGRGATHGERMKKLAPLSCYESTLCSPSLLVSSFFFLVGDLSFARLRHFGNLYALVVLDCAPVVLDCAYVSIFNNTWVIEFYRLCSDMCGCAREYL